MKRPYIDWNRDELYDKLKVQVDKYGFDEQDLLDAVYDPNWRPTREYNGCNVVQDPMHPFYPCFIHDWEWITGRGGNKSDLKFRSNLIKYGFTKWKANRYYFFVRAGWLLWYKWVNRDVKT